MPSQFAIKLELYKNKYSSPISTRICSIHKNSWKLKFGYY